MKNTVNQTVPDTTGNSVLSAKKSLRSEKLLRRKNLDPAIRYCADSCINSLISHMIQQIMPTCIVAYMTDGTEPDLKGCLTEYLEQGGLLYLPRFESSSSYRIVRADALDFSGSKWGIPEPGADAPDAPEEHLEQALWLIPGVAFDASYHRLGRGKGVYDRLLAKGAAYSAGIFYECQRCEAVPAEPHDCLLDAVVTEQGIFSRKAFSQINAGDLQKVSGPHVRIPSGNHIS